MTDAVFVERPGAEEGSGTASAGARLVTCSKDATVRVWDLDTQHCAQTIAALGAECWSLDVDPPRARRLAVGTMMIGCTSSQLQREVMMMQTPSQWCTPTFSAELKLRR